MRTKRFLSILLSLVMVLGLMIGMSMTAYADGKVAKVGETEYATLSDALNAWNDGTTLTLLANVEPTSTINMSSGTKTFALNGHNIKMTGGSGSVFQVTGGNLKVNGPGSISGGKGMPDSQYWEIRGGGFYVADNAKVTVNNVTITGNTAYYGGGVYLGGNATFTMNNGTISHNHIDNYKGYGYTSGGGVWIEGSGTFIMNGGSVTENTADSQIAGIHVFNNGTFKVSGNAIVTNNTRGSSQINVSGTITVDGELTEGANIGVNHDAGVFTNSTYTDYNDASKFTSDNASYAVGKNADGQLLLGIPVTVKYKVVNGTWSDDSKGELTETVASGSKPASVPTGMKASEGFTGGAWDENPADATIMGEKTFIFTFTAKQAATVTKVPVAKPLTYTGSAQELVTEGTASGGTMQYALGENATTAPTSGWDTSIPTATNAGTYYVWYKVIADADHKDSEPVCIKVVIQSAAYAVLKVDNADYPIGSGQNAVITVKRSAGDDRTFSLYTGAAMDGTPIASGNCDTAPGSLILTLKSFYLDSLSVGDHKLTISFQDGSVDTTVKILPAASVPTPTPKPVPKTGDSGNPALWLAMMLVALIGFAGLAVTGTMKASRKKK